MTGDIKGKTILVTGATSGIGLEASVKLARARANLVLAGRTLPETVSAVEYVKANADVNDVSYLVCDFASQDAIRKLAGDYRARHDRLDVLVNNAGTVYKKRTLTVDGIEATFAVNHLGCFLLTNLLLDLIRKSAPSRIVTVASIGHRMGTLDFDDLGFERGGYWVMRAYGRSKLANVMFAAELARRLAGTGVTSNSLHPGAVNTNIWSGAPAYAKPLIYLFVKPFLISAKQGADTIVQLAADPALDGVTGKYFEKKRPVSPAPAAQDEALARRLWDVSARLVKLTSI
jgi:NAD(P)-dependent dehydrogenase (short-subunit alcohol dehydrogenase family)